MLIKLKHANCIQKKFFSSNSKICESAHSITEKSSELMKKITNLYYITLREV